MWQLTSLAMVMNALGIKRKRADCQFEDELYNIANLAGMVEVVYGKILGMFMKNIQGIFRHWGVTISAEAISKSIANLGRLYLWA